MPCEKRYALLALLAATILACGAPARAGQPMLDGLRKLSEALKEGEPAFTAEDVAPAVKTIIPLVERAAGRSFKQPPKVEIADRKQVIPALERDLLPQLKNLAPAGTSDLMLRAAAKQQAATYARCLLGKYGFHVKTLYLLPRNFQPLLKLAKTDLKHQSAIMKLIIAHELTHCLQDQHVGLTKTLASTNDIEAMQALNAVIEGQAVFVQDVVGEQLGLGAAVLETARLFSAGAVELDDPALEVINKVISTQFEQIYLGGRDFIAHHHARGGAERVWQILASPPRETSMIARPETYSTLRKARVDLKAVLDGLEKDFGERAWTVKNLRIGNMLLRSALANVEPKKRDEIVAKVERVRALVAQSAAPMAMANVSIYVLKEPAFAPRMVAIQEEAVRKNVAKTKGSAMMSFSDLEIEPFAKTPADATVARKVSFTVTVRGVGARQKHVIVRIGRGGVVLELYAMNLAVSDETFAAIAEKVYARYLKAQGAQPQPKIEHEDEDEHEDDRAEAGSPPCRESSSGRTFPLTRLR